MKTAALWRNARFWICLLFALLLAVGLLTADDYGVYCDQLSEQVIVRENLKEYAARFGDTDAVAYYDSLGIQRISESIEIDHGQSVYYPLSPALTLIQTQPDLLSKLWHGYTWLIFWSALIALYGLLRAMDMNRPLALCGMLLLLLSPRFFAEGHYNNKDIVLLTLTLWVFFLGLRFLQKPCIWRGVLFSFVGGLAANTKIVGLAAWGLMGLCAVILLTVNRRWSRKMVLTAVVTILSFAAVYAALTPAMWENPVEYFRYLLANASGFTRWPGVVIFRDMVFEHKINPLPRYYLPYMMVATLPLYFFPLCAVGQLSLLRRCLREKTALLREPKALVQLSATVLWVLFMGYVVLTRPLIYNGWRHFYFLFAGFVILAAQGLQSLWDFARKRGRLVMRGGVIVCCLCLLASAVGIALNHPYQYVYYNPLFRANAETAMELDYWDVSTVNAIRSLMNSPRNTELPLVLGSRDDMSWFGLNTARTALTQEELDTIQLVEDGDAPYLFVNTTYGIIYSVEVPEGYHELFRLTGYGNTVATVYEKDTVSQAL